MSQDHTTFPHILQATMEMAAANNVTEGEKPDIIRRLDTLLGADGVTLEELKAVDDWIGTLTRDQVQTLVDGEETECAALVAGAPDPEETEGLLRDIFNDVIS